MAGSSWTNQVQSQVIIAGTAGQLLVYSGPPASGNLISSISGVATTDLFGNTVFQGTTNIKFSAGVYYAINSGINNLLTFLTATNPGGPWNNNGGFGQGTNFMSVVTPSFRVSAQFTSTGGLPASPTVITTDTWQNMILLNGWTVSGGGYAEYKLEPNNRVSVRGANLSTGTITNNTSIWTPPAFYNPSVTQRIGAFIEASTGAAGVDTPRFDTGTGFFSCFNIPTGTTLVGFQDSYALD